MNDLRKSGENAFSPTFKAWKQRVTQSLAEVFGKDHDYTRRFKGLSFWEMRMSIGQHRWSPLDQAKFENDFIMAEQLLSDVFEDFEIASPINQPTPEKIPVSGPTSPPIIINVTNVLSQTTDVQINQLLASLDDLNLSDEDRSKAENSAKELEREAKGPQRWSALSKPLETLKALGKPVYERIAIPMLLEMLKKQAGL